MTYNRGTIVQYFSKREAAMVLGISLPTLYSRLRSGHIKTDNGRLDGRIKTSEVINYLTRTLK